MVLLDLTKAFELVPHDVLIRAARACGYPLFLLRMTLAAYRLTRHVGLDGVYSDGYVASRGITAGSGFATTELRLLLLRCIDSTYYVFRPLRERG